MLAHPPLRGASTMALPHLAYNGVPPQSVPLLHCPQGKQLMWALPIKQKNSSTLAMKLYHFL